MIASAASPAAEGRSATRAGLGRLQAVGLLGIWVVFAHVYAVPFGDERHVWFGGDQALLLKAADDTLAGHPPLVGAPSRSDLFHPGPLFVYFLALIQAITRHREAVSIALVSLLQAGTVPLLALLSFRLSGSFALSASLPFLVVLNYPFIVYMRFLWNVAIVIPALALALWLALKADRPTIWVFPALAATLSLIAQAHMGFAPLAAWLGLAVAGRALLSKPSFPGRAVALTGAVLAFVWSSVAWDALAHHGGNPAKLVERFGAPYERHAMSEVFRTVDTLAAESLRGGPWTRRTLLGASAGLLLLAGLRRVPEAGLFRWMLLLLGGSWAAFIWSVRAIPEPIQTYYLRPVYVLVAATLIGGAAALVALTPGAVPRGSLAMVIALLVVALSAGPALEMRKRFSDIRWNSYPLGEMREVVRAIVARSEPAISRPARVNLRLGNLAGAEESFRYLLGREGVEQLDAAEAPALRLTLVSTAPAHSDENWVEVTRTGTYRLEKKESARPFETGPVR